MSFDVQTFSDGGARGNPGPAAVAAVVCDAKGKILKEASRCIGETTNNKAEYNAMLLALELARERKARRVLCHADSELIVFQLQGLYKIKNAELKRLAEKVKSMATHFESVTFRQVPREHAMISRADKLLNQSLDRARPSHKAAAGKPASPPKPCEGGQPELFDL